MTRRRKLFSTRRSKKIAPGVRLTLTKKGVGMSVKIPGAGSYSTRTGKVGKTEKKGCLPTVLSIVILPLLLITLVFLF